MESQALPHLQRQLLHQKLLTYHAQFHPYPSSSVTQEAPEQPQHLPEQPSFPPPPPPPTEDQTDLDFLQLTNSFQTDSSSKKRRRLDIEEKRFLNQVFFQNPKPNSELRAQLAQRLDMTPRGIQIWFQNQRSKVKRAVKTTSTGDEEKDEDSASSASRDFRFPQGNPREDPRESGCPASPEVLAGPSEDESSNSMHLNFLPTMVEETREQPTAEEPPRPYRTNFEPQADNAGDGSKPKVFKKQRRRRLNPEETDALLQIFEETQKPDSAYRLELSARLNLPPQVIEIWFQNQRAKRKRRTVNSGPHPHGEDAPPIDIKVAAEEYYPEVAVNTNNPTCAQEAANKSVYAYDGLNLHTPSASNDHPAFGPYADQIITTSGPGQSATGSNYGGDPGTSDKSQKRKSTNTRRSSRAASAFSLDGDGRMIDQHPQQRRRMTKEEICILSAVFARTRMPTIDTREELAKQFDRTPRSIQIWFQNQRSKLKRGLVSLESYRRIGEGILRRDMDNMGGDEGDVNEGDGEWMEV